MIKGLLGRGVAVIAVAVGLATGAAAQNYDGNGIVRFGVFGAGESYDLSAKGAGLGSTSIDGAAIGFSAGYDLIFDRRFMVGIEADLQVGDTISTLKDLGIKTHADYLASVRGRLGVFMGPQFLIYGTGGVAWTGLGVEDTIAGATGALDDSRTLTGWIAGGGLELDVGNVAGFGTLIFAEYLVAQFDGWKDFGGLGVSVDPEVQTFRIGVKLKLGHDYHEERRGGAPMK